MREKTGLIIDAYFSATKIKWIFDNVPGVRELADEGKLLFGTVETWLIWNLTGGKVHVTDYSNASRTMLFDVDNLCWDEVLCKKFDIPMSILPRPVPPARCMEPWHRASSALSRLRACPSAARSVTSRPPVRPGLF